jgi:hypothetical protein
MPELNRQPEDVQPQDAPLLRPTTDATALVRLLEEFARGDEAEQRETFEFLKRALDEGRRPGYKLFSNE